MKPFTKRTATIHRHPHHGARAATVRGMCHTTRVFLPYKLRMPGHVDRYPTIAMARAVALRLGATSVTVDKSGTGFF